MSEKTNSLTILEYIEKSKPTLIELMDTGELNNAKTSVVLFDKRHPKYEFVLSVTCRPRS